MRTITKLRLPAYVFIAMVLLTALSGRLWVMAVLAVVFGSIAAWYGPVRCPQCNDIAGYRRRRFWAQYMSLRGICGKCGANFFKV